MFAFKKLSFGPLYSKETSRVYILCSSPEYLYFENSSHISINVKSISKTNSWKDSIGILSINSRHKIQIYIKF
jgi:hypothetical protein